MRVLCSLRMTGGGCKPTLKMSVDIKLGDVVRLRKPHPCGSYEWEIVRVGADIGLKCLKCQRRVLLERGVFERRLKEVVSKSD